MTRDEIIKALGWHAPAVEMGPQGLLRRVETLVAQAEAAEREACAKVCYDADKSTHPTDLGDAILAREAK